MRHDAHGMAGMAHLLAMMVCPQAQRLHAAIIAMWFAGADCRSGGDGGGAVCWWSGGLGGITGMCGG